VAIEASTYGSQALIVAIESAPIATKTFSVAIEGFTYSNQIFVVAIDGSSIATTEIVWQ